MKDGEGREEEGKKESTKEKEQKVPPAPISKSKQAQLKVETTVRNLQATLEHLRGRWEVIMDARHERERVMGRSWQIRKEEIKWGR